MEETISFGFWLKRRRKALDLTQDELARQVGVSSGTIKKREADERRPSKQVALRLADVLAVPPSDRVTFLKVARAELAADRLTAATATPPPADPSATPLPRRHNLPAPSTPLIGRAKEVAAVCGLVQRSDVRLVTLTGVGGTGKTRLALQVATEVSNRFSEGVWFVDLAPVREPTLVTSAIATVLGVKEVVGQSFEERLAAALREQQVLLVLDNFEHLLAVAPVVAEWLRAAPGLTVLVTSRAVLHLSGEHEFPVPPLALPDSRMPLDELAQNAAVRLFVAQAQAVKPAFALTNTHAAAVAEICLRLEGLPLAIELAAARVKLFAPALLLQRLDQRLRELTGGPRDLPARQQTLRSTLEWSYQLLDTDAQALFRRLAVFVGGATLEAVEAVCRAADDGVGDVLAGLQGLVDQSLVQVVDDPEGTPRFTMLETIREYAVERLQASGEEAVVRRQHGLYYLALVEAMAPKFRGPEQTVEFQRLDREHDNLRAALRWTLDHAEAEHALRLASALTPFWLMRGHTSEGRRWLDAALALEGPAESALRAQALMAAGDLSYQETAQYEEALRLFRELGDKRNMAQALWALANVTWTQSDLTRSATLFQESLDLFRELDDADGIGWTLGKLGWLALNQGEYARCSSLLEESLRLGRRLGDQQLIFYALTYLGFAAMEQRDFTWAVMLQEQCLAFYRDVGFKLGVAWLLQYLSWVALWQGDYARGTALNEESLRVFQEFEEPPGADGTACCLMARGLLELDHGALAEARVALADSLGRFAVYRDQRNIARCLEGCAALAAAHVQRPEDTAQARRAARLWSAAAVLRSASGFRQSPADRVHDEPYLAAARAQLDDASWEAAWAEGRAMTTEQAVVYALDGEDDRPIELP